MSKNAPALSRPPAGCIIAKMIGTKMSSTTENAVQKSPRASVPQRSTRMQRNDRLREKTTAPAAINVSPNPIKNVSIVFMVWRALTGSLGDPREWLCAGVLKDKQPGEAAGVELPPVCYRHGCGMAR